MKLVKRHFVVLILRVAMLAGIIGFSLLPAVKHANILPLILDFKR